MSRQDGGRETGPTAITPEAVEAAANIPGVAILAAEAAVFDAMIEHGPDGHTDGHDKIARAAIAAAAPHIAAQALTLAAHAVELMPPQLRAQYVETLRLYASEPWRLGTLEPMEPTL